MFSDPIYDPAKEKSWWEVNWKKAVQWIVFATVFITSLVLMCIPGTQAFGVGMFIAGMKAAVSGAIIGGLIGGVMSAIRGNSFWEGASQGAIYGFINGFSAGAIMFCASQGVQALAKAANARTAKPTCCFVAGTLVLTSEGNKPIEEIEAGDLVWAYDEETGEREYKEVVQIFRNESSLRTTLSSKLITLLLNKNVSAPGYKYSALEYYTKYTERPYEPMNGTKGGRLSRNRGWIWSF